MSRPHATVHDANGRRHDVDFESAEIAVMCFGEEHVEIIDVKAFT
jgi:hypothetical protein